MLPSGYPQKDAAIVALETIRKFLTEDPQGATVCRHNPVLDRPHFFNKNYIEGGASGS